MGKFTDDQKLHHYMGIEMNIQTWNLLGKEDRNEKDDFRMLNFAKSSLYHWPKSPKFEPINEQRAQWLVSHVYAILGKGDQAMRYAEKTIRITKKHGFNDFDLAYAYEALARAHAAAGNKEECNSWLKKAKEAGNLINGKEDKKIFDGDLETEPWFGCRPK